jgi:CDP-paratose 2-epimerase
VAGGNGNSSSLRRLSAWCADRFGTHPINVDPENRKFDVPWLVLSSAETKRLWQWEPEIGLNLILEEIAVHAEQNPDCLELTSDTQ